MNPISIAIVTDAWAPQVNGVVRTLTETTTRLRLMGHQVEVISPDQFRSIPAPSYPEIRLAIASPSTIERRLDAIAPDAIHIATEGPLGWAARRYCLKHGRSFTTAYHTQFPEYLARRTKLPASTFWPYIRNFHRPAQSILVATESVRRQLRAQGLTRLAHWSRGVDLSLFSPDHEPPSQVRRLPRPIQLYVGRVAVEKNIEAFLRSNQPGSKVVVGDGPALAKLRQQFPDVHFFGKQQGETLASCYAAADVFVFPSKTDTFGLVMIEALASGVPVAAYPVTGPIDILRPNCGAMDDDLNVAIAKALRLDRADCFARGQQFTWEASTQQFLDALAIDQPGKALQTDYAAPAPDPITV